jgi:hypothetical protein
MFVLNAAFRWRTVVRGVGPLIYLKGSFAGVAVNVSPSVGS